MADLILYWSTRSPFVRKVMVAAHELGVAARIRQVPTLVAATAPNMEHLAVNPLGRIPTMVLADGTVLYESQAIIEYLNEYARGWLVPPNGMPRIQAMRWHGLGTGLLDVLVAWNSERNRSFSHQVAMAGYEAKTRATLDLLERESGRLRGTDFNIGHIAVGCALGYLDFRFAHIDWRTRHPNLAKLYEKLAQRASFADTLPS